MAPMRTDPRGETPFDADADLVGVPGSRHRLETPALLVDLPALTRNIARLSVFAAERGISLRPHVKTHKSIKIARRQIAAGALGVSCATLGEAEVMVSARIPGVLLTSPIVADSKIRRLIDLARRAGPGSLIVVADHPRNVADLAQAAAVLDHPLDILVDHAAGYGRTGVACAAEALDLARCISGEASLRLRGLQAYAGHLQHIPERSSRSQAAAAIRTQIRDTVDAAAAHGIAFEIVTGAGTGTVDLDAQEPGVFTELQAGSYVFMDADYASVLADATGTASFEVALFVQAAVVSTNAPDWVTVDAGTKCFATDAGLPVVARGAGPGSLYAFAGDEHGRVRLSGGRSGLGDRIEFVTPHCDPTVNLHDVYHVVEGDTLVDLWRVDARGRH